MEPISTAVAAKGLGSLVGAGFNYFGNRAQARAARRAQEEANRILQQGIDFQKGVYTDAQGNLKPMIEAGQRGTASYEQAINDFTQPTLDYTQKDFTLDNWKDPGYQFRLDEANKSINAKMAKSGMGLGSGALKSLQTRGQDMASQEYANAYDRFLKDSAMRYGQASDQYGRDFTFDTTKIGQFGDLSKLGATAASSLMGGGNTAAGNISNIYGTQAENAGNAAITQGQADAANWWNIGNLAGTGVETGYNWLDEWTTKQKKNPANVMKNSVIGQANKQGSLL